MFIPHPSCGARPALVSLLLVQALSSAPVRSEPIPEDGLRIKPSSWYFELKEPEAFEVARPDSFDDMSHFKISDMSFEIDADLEAVWNGYLTTNPLKIWSNNRSRVVAAWIPSTGETMDREDLALSWPGFEEGMKIFLDMSSLPVAVTHEPAMMVALQITRLDHDAKVVVFRYLEGTPSYGEQVIAFSRSPDSPHITRISHRTWFRSYGRLVELLYPMYHRMMTRGMHARFKWEIEGESGP